MRSFYWHPGATWVGFGYPVDEWGRVQEQSQSWAPTLGHSSASSECGQLASRGQQQPRPQGWAELVTGFSAHKGPPRRPWGGDRPLRPVSVRWGLESGLGLRSAGKQRAIELGCLACSPVSWATISGLFSK